MNTLAQTVAITAAAVTSVGCRRSINEDSLIADWPLYLVADGMGGHAAGDLASGMAVEELGRLKGTEVGVADIGQALDRARQRISAIDCDARRPAGTTITGVVIVAQAGDPYWLVVNLGDSRTYRLLEGQLEQLSVDHSEVQGLLDAGQINQAEARSHPLRNVVTKVLGAGTLEQPDYWLLPVEQHERLLICSDGLPTELPDDMIEQILIEQPQPTAAADALLAAALAHGGRDNISIIVIDARHWRDDVVTTASSLDDASEDTIPIGLGSALSPTEDDQP